MPALCGSRALLSFTELNDHDQKAPSLPHKRESSDFARTTLGPHVRGDDGLLRNLSCIWVFSLNLAARGAFESRLGFYRLPAARAMSASSLSAPLLRAVMRTRMSGAVTGLP